MYFLGNCQSSLFLGAHTGAMKWKYVQARHLEHWKYAGSLYGSDSKESACNVRDLGSILGSGRSPRERNGNPLQYSCLETSMDRGVWWATAHGVAKSQTQLSDYTLTFTFQESTEGISR